ncbi:uncharacterized protein LOC100120537 isoform X1 [Nasonia vitripennis]|uniref:FAM234A/B beta-propeller domain-containing protein n=2 Tax=Nasonia vitripennis TaxID=7425 RepID=A0A7M7H9B6_NASVI|nr:uncharacterized protein LOC100120537 isoform X1 [Nasonia vitripennis]XP_008210394.1 uncharacterized protein LOC100120537 isoform X1 [Nasonia vitripennis]
MTGVYPNLPRVAVRDSFDDDDLSDVDDEVFIRDGKNGILKIDDECGVKRPLMAPRRKCKTHFSETSHLPYKTLFAPFCYTLIGFVIVLGIIGLCIIIITRFPVPMNIFKTWVSSNKQAVSEKKHVVPCTSLNANLQWTRTLPKLTSEAPLRSNDVNGDNIEDIIVGFSTGLDKAESPEYVCALYFDQSAPCLGGVMALDGKSGETLWTHWTAHAIFSVDCGLDLTGDKVKDCIIAGRGGILHAINGQDGNILWELPYRDLSMLTQQRFYDIYDARYIADVDDDGVGDIVASHTWQAGGSQSEVLLVSGKNGNKINSMDFPGKEQLFVAPQIIVHPDGETYFVLTSSDQEKNGGLFIIPHSKLLKGEFKLQELYHGAGKGVSLPPLIIDVNSDGTEDIIVAMTNATIMAIDGLTFKEIWNFTIANSEVISIPVPGYYNDDKIPDFMVKHQIGPGFPVYYYTSATILDGKTGKPLLEAPMEDSLSAQMSGLSVTVDGYGNDWFLHWSADCLGVEGAKDAYEFVKTPNADADLCKLRFNSTLVTSLFAFSQHVEPPGISLYRSEDWRRLEFNNSIDPRKAAQDYANSHSAFSNTDGEIVSNRSPSRKSKYRKNNEARHKSVENDEFAEPDNYYPRSKNIKYDNMRDDQAGESFLNKALDELNEDGWKSDKWDNDKSKDNVQTDDNYDDTYDDDEERMIASRQLNEIRLQRSEKSNARYINNDTNDVENQLDPSMDYTNGQSKQNNYYSSLPFNRSNNADDGSDYMNIPDIDFVDNIKDAEALDDRSRRSIKDNESALKQNESEKDSKSIKNRLSKVNKRDTNMRKKNPLSKIAFDYRMARFFNRRLKKEADDKDFSYLPTGLQRQPPTGILLPSLKSDKKNPVDLVFSTYWLPASNTPFVLLPKDLQCIREAEENAEEKLSSDEREAIITSCLANRGVNYQSYQEATDKENVKIALGQMTLYRMQLQCVCPEDMLPGQTCKDISKQQSWPEHLGASGSGYFEPLPK